MAFKFEKLEIWKLALDMADKVDILTQAFPKHELFILTAQMKRAADSISLNIAEGSTGQSNAEQARFLSYAQRSAIEVVDCCFLALRRKYMTQETFNSLFGDLDKLVAMNQAFKNKIKQLN